MGWVQSEKDKLQKSLFGSRPIEPVDTRATDIGVGDIEGFVKDRDRQFFRDFASFAD
jgi:hypothetical protein